MLQHFYPVSRLLAIVSFLIPCYLMGSDFDYFNLFCSKHDSEEQALENERQNALYFILSQLRLFSLKETFDHSNGKSYEPSRIIERAHALSNHLSLEEKETLETLLDTLQNKPSQGSLQIELFLVKSSLSSFSLDQNTQDSLSQKVRQMDTTSFFKENSRPFHMALAEFHVELSKHDPRLTRKEKTSIQAKYQTLLHAHDDLSLQKSLATLYLDLSLYSHTLSQSQSDRLACIHQKQILPFPFPKTDFDEAKFKSYIHKLFESLGSCYELIPSS